jgi:hypothetical protein
LLTNSKQMETKISPISPKFYCEYCLIKTNNKKDYEKHILTAKHKKNSSVNAQLTKFPQISQNEEKKYFTCDNCEKMYKSRTGLWKHKQICCQKNNINTLISNELILKLFEDKNEMKQIILEQNNTINNLVKNGITNISNNNNCHNKTFNLNFFLNEQCKDAVNMSDFLESMRIELSDLENTGRLGFVEGISKLLLKNLRALDTYKRPIHCSDLKRQTLYIKDNNKWEKENDEKIRLKNAIRIVANQNIKKISDWTKEYPECRDSESKKNDQYLHIVSNSMCGGSIEETQKNLENIVKNIAKEVLIEK